MTTKLYYEDTSIKAWDSEVLTATENDGHFYVTLFETAFYPEGGGQPADRGRIGGIEVLDVQVKNEAIVHVLASKPELGKVHCELDWKRRFDHMQHHSGQHLLSAVCRELFDANTLSFHLGTDYVTIDVDIKDISHDQMKTIEQLANQYIYENKKLHTYFITSEQLKELPVVKLPKVTENIRIVEMEGIEYNPCGGTHVRQTGEIGIIKLLKTEKHKGFTRIYFKCGFRALQDFQESLTILTALSSKYSAGRDDILDRVNKSEQNQKHLLEANEKLKEELAFIEMKEILSENNGFLITREFPNKTLKELQLLATKITSEREAVVLFGSVSENKAVLYQNGINEVQCGQFFKQNLGRHSGKGGGNDKSAQAGFPDYESLAGFLTFAKLELKKLTEK
ncbi:MULTISPECIES: alanyl-tRNA editing protein [Bacillaceae]|uniref:Alanyl-tRNA synthetase n=1 Tax=Peribacillus huizhouensis TaxID=1501239 RepID=A0ABR6CVB4_9BACI|nr:MULTISPECIES: DHHA1 domain-containing protein [Bacillaceae]MBA9028972.1 alanyl-tRNA synthetase [Peribacillus huizhouensis]